MQQTPLITQTNPPLLREDGDHWDSHGSAVHHIRASSCAAEARVYSCFRARHPEEGAYVVLSISAYPMIMHFHLSPDDAMRLASALVNASAMAAEVQAERDARDAAAREGGAA